ncbi:hypothetical protein QYM36_009445, partial [Artemia franciscana]
MEIKGKAQVTKKTLKKNITTGLEIATAPLCFLLKKKYQQEQVSDKVVQLLRSYLNCIFDHVMTCTTQKLSFRLKYWDRVVTDCDFADNIALVTKSESQLLMALNTLLDESARTGLSIYWEKTKIMMEKKCAKLILTNKNIKRVSGIMLEEIEMGLRQKSNKNADIKCYPTYVRNLPNGKEKGKFLALDLGGTNFRVLLIQLGETAPEKEFVSREFPLPDLIRTSSGEALFDHIAECLALFVKEFKVDKEIIPLGFTFSFPCRQEGLTKAKLVQWTKGFTCSEVEGRDVAELLQNAIHKRKDVHIKIMAVLNDTTGTLMSSAYKQPNCKIGLIIGTGTNACYVEKIENMELLDGDSDDSNQCIVNTEWGAFGDNGSLDFIRTDFDRALDSVTSNRGKQ